MKPIQAQTSPFGAQPSGMQWAEGGAASLSHNFLQQNNVISLTLSGKSLTGQKETGARWTMRLDNRIQFKILYAEKQNIDTPVIGFAIISFIVGFNHEFLHPDPRIVDLWVVELGKIISQLNIRDYFLPKKVAWRGSFETVYFVGQKNGNDNRLLAVRSFSKKGLSQEHLRMVTNQIQILRGLDHPNTLKILSVFESLNSIYLLTDRYYRTLSQRLQYMLGNNPLPPFTPKQTKQIVRGVLRGLAYLHERDIAHRNIHPKNILLRDDNELEPVITGFRYSCFPQEVRSKINICGTPGFMAPECYPQPDAGSTKVYFESDTYALGVCFYVMIFGRSPTINERMNLALLEQSMSLNSDAKLKDLILGLMEPNLAKRITVSEALDHPYLNYQLPIAPPILTSSAEANEDIASAQNEKEQEGDEE